MDFRGAVSDGEVDLDSLRGLVVARDEAETEAAVSDAQLRSALREEYDIPDQLSDSEAEAVLSAALSAVISEDVDAADERLSEKFSTVCERESPEEQATAAGHPAACHLHDSATEPDEQWEWASVD